jgi:flagellar motility protein MotE (MotC chaperone)
MFWLFLPCSATFNSGAADGSSAAPKTPQPSAPKSSVKRVPSGDAPLTAEKSQELLEKEAALSVKEQELKKMSTGMDARIKELDVAKKSLEVSLSAKKKLDNERYKKMMKLYKALRPEEAAKLLDKLDEDIAFEMLNQMDQKTTAKLIPLLNQARVLKWTKLTLQGK